MAQNEYYGSRIKLFIVGWVSRYKTAINREQKMMKSCCRKFNGFQTNMENAFSLAFYLHFTIVFAFDFVYNYCSKSK